MVTLKELEREQCEIHYNNSYIVIFRNSYMEVGVDHVGVAVVFFCHDGDGNYLLSRNSENSRDEVGRWNPGAGNLEFEDTVAGTLKKEILEEYSTSVLSYEFLGYRDVHRIVNGNKTHWVGLDFKVLVDKALVQNGEPHKHDKIGWFRMDNLPSPLHSEFYKCLKKYKNRL